MTDKENLDKAKAKAEKLKKLVARLQKVKDKQDESKLRTHISSLSDEGGT